MPIYKLTPIDLSHPDWEASTHRGECHVHAKSPESAREAARDQFVRATERKSPHEDVKMQPWTNPERVTCVEVFDAAPDAYHEGLIEIPDSLGGYDTPETPAFRTIETETAVASSGPPLGVVAGAGYNDLPASLDKAEQDQAGHEVRSDAKPLPTSDDRIRQAVRHNRTVILAYSSSLLQVLDEVLGQSTMPLPNEPTAVLWLAANDDQDTELKELLRQVRDELRRLNDYLASDKKRNAILPKVAKKLGSAADRFVKAFGATTGTGAGAIVVCILAELLEKAGIVNWDRYLEILRLVSK